MELTDKEISRWVTHWRQEGKEALDTARDLIQNKHYHYALFFCHLALEKIIKAVYLVRKKEFPPPVHDLLYLIKKAEVPVSKDETVQFAEINTYNIRARYDHYKRVFYKKATAVYSQKWLRITKKLFTEMEQGS